MSPIPMPTPEPEQDAAPVREGEHVPPEFHKEAYHCPYCGVLTSQYWTSLYGHLPGVNGLSEVGAEMTICLNCDGRSFWAAFVGVNTDYRMIKPVVGGGPRPHVDMPEDVRRDYEEARS